ncbi:unnamed protein product [Diamesa hyperborea]
MHYILLTFLVICGIVHYTNGFSEVLMEYAEEMIVGSKFADYSKIKVKKVNRTTHLMMGEMTYFVDVGDDYKFLSVLYKKVGMDYQKTIYKLGPKDFCKYYNEDRIFYPDMLLVSDLPKQGTCPWPAKTYNLRGYIVNLSRIPPTFNGHYMVESTIQKDGEILAGYRVYGSVHSLVGEYVDVSITKGEPINTTGDFGDLTGVKVRKINRKHVITGDFHYKKGLSNDQQCKVLFYKKQGGEYRLLSYKIPAQGCCDFYNSDNFIVPELAKVCKKCPKQEDKVCPWPGAIGYLDVTVTRGEVMKGDSSYIDFSQLRVKKINREHVIIGNGTFLKDIGNDVQCKIVLYKKQGGEYRLTQFKIPVKGFCDFWDTETFLVPDLQNSCELCPMQDEKHCPWKAAAGYLDVSVTRGEVLIGDSIYADYSQVKVKKINREHVLIGNATFLKEIGNDIQCKILLYKKQGGEYRLTQFKIPVKGFCDFYNTETLIVPDLENYCELCPKQKDNHCPWKAQPYFINGFKLTGRNVPPFFEGEYMGSVQFIKDDVILAGYNVYATVIR